MLTGHSHPRGTHEVPDNREPGVVAREWIVSGRVQGVGFRPFVYRLAHRLQLKGWVRNELGQVVIVTQGDAAAIERFGSALLADAPPLARPEILACAPVDARVLTGFEILASSERAQADIHVPPDYFICDDCLRELRDPADRRYRYPFINCTQCGPRYTIIDRLPYDRSNTSMAGFALCADCRAEYGNPLDRRFHAEPVACPACGPALHWHLPGTANVHETEAALEACLAALREGLVVAVKGVGGYHLLCDARRDESVRVLRQSKARPHKPLALMVPQAGADGLDHVRAIATPSAEEAAALTDPMRPIVLIRMRPDAGISRVIAPGLAEVGVMLPYSPLHHLLADRFGAPLVATSANHSGEPVFTEAAEVEARLCEVADAFLHHNRPIRRPADDSVMRAIAGRVRPLRMGRGCAPLELPLPVRLRSPLLAVGGHMKSTIALAWDDRAVISPHIGDLGTPRSLAVFEQVIEDLQRLYGVRAQRVACDAHPNYGSTRWALRSGLLVHKVFHHHAHASALAGEYRHGGPLLVFTWDGTGYGEDATSWGGEALLGRAGAWRRAASFRSFCPPGGDRAGLDPWRSALALCWETGVEWHDNRNGNDMLRHAWLHGINCPPTTAVGRLFDAAAALVGLLQQGSFEGHGPMWLEAACADAGEPVELPLARDPRGVWRSDWAPLLPMLLDAAVSPAVRAARFHATLAHTLLHQAERVREEHRVHTVGLVGGVFQNRRLTEQATALLRDAGFDVLLPSRIPVNDAGISYGQVHHVAAAAEQ